MQNNRRSFLKKSAVLTLGGISFTAIGARNLAEGLAGIEMLHPFELPPLPYPYDALEPHIDKQTMELHYDKHHAAYVTNLNKALKELKEPPPLEEICQNISNYTIAVRNNAGGHFNHLFFWKIMKPQGGGIPGGILGDAINATFGTFENFKTKFNDTALNRFGSGWAWLVSNKGKLEIGSTANQDNPLMDVSELRGTPILGIDVWEHAYYLKYQNKRKDYLNNWWNVTNWNQAALNFAGAK